MAAREERDLARDTGTDDHPLGTAAGSTGGVLAGAAVGAMAGPLGAVVGGVAGAVMGGLAGKAAAELVNPTQEEAFWRGNYERESYFEQGRSYDDYAPAYRMGLEGRMKYGEDWSSVEPRLASEWPTTRGGSTLDWPAARHASRAAWTRVDNTLRTGGAAAAVGSVQSGGDGDGDVGDVIDLLKDLVECSKDGEYGFRECAEHAKRADLKGIFLQRADDCRSGAQELNAMIRSLGGSVEEGGSAMGALHRGWVAVKSALTGYDDKAILAECERGEDNAKARYRSALDKPMPQHVRQLVQRQLDGVIRNHDQVKVLRDQFR
ncbi:ferritin-like domain-containing protein [Ramlibacter sp.]|uniref:ferritin-like domain-containing protein n=1 Tax=Ramlibacter sp. TaxID=1917967 RepID=UPI003D0AD37B